MVDPVTAIAAATTAFNAIKKGFQFGGFLDTLKNVFGSVREKFRFGDKLKLLLSIRTT